MQQKINFNAGPAALPQEVLQQASQAIIEYENTGVSILGLPHRGKHFDAILEESKALVKEFCSLGDDYEVLWMHGGGRLQFTMIPMNFLGDSDTAGYLDSGSWSTQAITYAHHYGKVEILGSSKEDDYTRLPDWPEIIDNGLSYVHMTTNNTIYGTQWKELPNINVPLIADMSSDIFSRKVDYSNCAMFYAVAQKNIGPAGATLVVVRKDMLRHIKRVVPPMMDYSAHAEKNSVLNTPPVFAIYTSLLTLRWMKSRGMERIEKDNERKAQLLYDEVERNSLFHSPVYQPHRSMMNVKFSAVDEDLTKPFVAFCDEHGVTGIEGHWSLGGFRPSLYNAISVEDVEKLIALMQEFEHNHKK